MSAASKKQTRTPILGEWALTAKLGRRREYVLYSAQHISTEQPAYLRVLGSDATSTDRDRFLAEVAIVSKHREHFLPVHSFRSHGEGLVAVSEIPEKTLCGHSLAHDVHAIVKLCQKLAEALQLLHDAGRVHAALCREAIELVDSEAMVVRLLDTGMGLELGHTYSANRQRHLPPEVVGVVTASVDWDIYALGILGLEMMEDPDGTRSQDAASVALRALFLACTAQVPDKRPYTLGIVRRRLLDIAQLPTFASPAPAPRAPRPPSRAARLTPVEAQWFVNDCLTEAEVAAIEGFEPETLSAPARVLGSLLSVTAGTALALMLAAMLGLEAFGS